MVTFRDDFEIVSATSAFRRLVGGNAKGADLGKWLENPDLFAEWIAERAKRVWEAGVPEEVTSKPATMVVKQSGHRERKYEVVFTVTLPVPTPAQRNLTFPYIMDATLNIQSRRHKQTRGTPATLPQSRLCAERTGGEAGSQYGSGEPGRHLVSV
jgi:hypothetical protein